MRDLLITALRCQRRSITETQCNRIVETMRALLALRLGRRAAIEAAYRLIRYYSVPGDRPVRPA